MDMHAQVTRPRLFWGSPPAWPWRSRWSTPPHQGPARRTLPAVG